MGITPYLAETITDVSRNQIDPADITQAPNKLVEAFHRHKQHQPSMWVGRRQGPSCPDRIPFYDVLADKESAVRELSDETLKKIAHELTESLRENVSIDW